MIEIMKASFKENQQIYVYILKLHICNCINNPYVGTTNFLGFCSNGEGFIYESVYCTHMCFNISQHMVVGCM